jgi:hypothetical protein
MADGQGTRHVRDRKLRVDLTGQRFGILWVIEVARRDGSVWWRCRCDCGGETVLQTETLRAGITRSCGCFGAPHGNRTHGREPRRLFGLWVMIRQRCNNHRVPKYHRYGKRGIKVAAAWDRFEPFRDWALANGWRPGLQIDRIDNDGDYEPDNCRFVTNKVNANNKSYHRTLTWQGRTLNVAQWSEELGFSRSVITHRLARGWPVERIFTQPARKVSRRRPG